MMVMPANCRNPTVYHWAKRWPALVGHIYSPGGGSIPRLPFALDNGAYAAQVAGRPFDAEAFRSHIRKYAPLRPLWVVVPDVVGDQRATRELWARWVPELRELAVPLAYAVQDGAGWRDVPTDADVVFVGGSTFWKRLTLEYWPAHFPQVHVGRVNTERWLWRCVEAGVASCDGTGWFRGGVPRAVGLGRFLERHATGATRPAHANYSLF